MEIRTRFSIGDKIWTLQRSKAVTFEVKSISIGRTSLLLNQPEEIAVTYCGEYKDGNITTARENECFASREELVKYIIDE